MQNYDVVIIGAGSVGAPAAWLCAERGLKVAVVEQKPSVGRGQNSTAIGGIRATHSDAAKIAICQRSIEIFSSLDEKHGLDIEWHSGGYMFPVYRAADEQALKELLKKQQNFGLNIAWIDADRVGELAPGINPAGLRGATYSPDDGCASPQKSADAFYTLARRRGVDFYFNQTINELTVKNGRISALQSADYAFSADWVVNCAGAEADAVGRLCDEPLPIIADSHEAGVSEAVQPFFEPMIVDLRPHKESKNFYFYQEQKRGQLIFCFTPKPLIPGSDRDSSSQFLPLIAERLISLYPRLRNLRVRRIWRGLYPMTPDGFPIVGKSSKIANLFLAVGMCGQGYMLGPGLGEVIADTICGDADRHQTIFDQLTLERDFAGEEALK